MKRLACTALLGLAIVFCIVLAAMLAMRDAASWAVISPRTPNPTETLILAAAIQYYELPPGWEVGPSEASQELGADGRLYVFRSARNADRPWLSMSERVYLYPAEESAKQNFSRWETKYIPQSATGAWKHMPELDFPFQADQFQAACLGTLLDGMPGYACTAVARYRNFIIVILANPFVAQWPTLTDFRTVLELADQRAASATAQMPDEDPSRGRTPADAPGTATASASARR